MKGQLEMHLIGEKIPKTMTKEHEETDASYMKRFQLLTIGLGPTSESHD